MNKDEKIQLLQEIVKINSVNGNELEVANFLEDFFTKHGIQSKKVEYSPDRSNLIVEIGNGEGPVLAFDGHMDVVSEGNAELWSHPPFEAEIEDGKMYGRGVSDMKSGLMATVIAIVMLKEADYPINGTIRLLATVGEEVGLLGAEQLARLGYADDIESLVVCEPSGGPLKQLNAMGIPFKQDAGEDENIEKHVISIAHKGSLTYEVHSEGKAAHSSMPELGVDAIAGLVYYYQKQQEFFSSIDVKDDLLGEITPLTSMISGGEQVNSVASFASLTTKIRTIPEMSNTRLIEEIEALIAECNKHVKAKLSLHILQSSHPVRSDSDSKIVKLGSKVFEDVFHYAPPIIGIPGGTDAARFVEKNPDIEVIITGPGNTTAHQTDEYCYVDYYLEYIDFYIKLMENYFA